MGAGSKTKGLPSRGGGSGQGGEVVERPVEASVMSAKAGSRGFDAAIGPRPGEPPA